MGKRHNWWNDWKRKSNYQKDDDAEDSHDSEGWILVDDLDDIVCDVRDILEYDDRPNLDIDRVIERFESAKSKVAERIEELNEVMEKIDSVLPKFRAWADSLKEDKKEEKNLESEQD